MILALYKDFKNYLSAKGLIWIIDIQVIIMYPLSF